MKTELQDAIKTVASLASRSVEAFEWEYPMSYEQTDMKKGSEKSEKRVRVEFF